MRKPYPAVLALVFCLVLLLPAAARAEEAIPAMATNNMIVVSSSTDAPDAHPVHPAVYKIDGANYFKLRDLGKALDFHVGYDDETKIVYISGARGYKEEQGS